MMGKKKPGIEKVDAKTGEQISGINELLASLEGISPELLGKLGINIQDNPLFQQASDALSQSITNSFDPEAVTQAFNQNIADPSRQNFQDQVLPAIQERLGRSSATANTSLKGAVDLEKQLAGGLSNELINQQLVGQQALGQALGFAQAPQNSNLMDINALLQSLGLGTGTDLFALKQTPGQAGAGGAIGGVAGTALGSLFGQPAIGGTVGSAVGSQF